MSTWPGGVFRNRKLAWADKTVFVGSLARRCAQVRGSLKSHQAGNPGLAPRPGADNVIGMPFGRPRSAVSQETFQESQRATGHRGQGKGRSRGREPNILFRLSVVSGVFSSFCGLLQECFPRPPVMLYFALGSQCGNPAAPSTLGQGSTGQPGQPGTGPQTRLTQNGRDGRTPFERDRAWKSDHIKNSFRSAGRCWQDKSQLIH